MSTAVPGDDLAEVVALSNRFGADPMFVRAGGGNSSAKVDGVLWIKPSGVPLATLAAGDLVPLDRARLLALVGQDPATLASKGDPVMAAAAEARLGEAHGRRPSVELLFHALLPERLVLHTHPIHVNGVTCSTDGEALAARLFGDRAVWVPYTDPGLPLAHAILRARTTFTARTGNPAPPVTLLGNHGLIVGGETAADIEAETAWLVGVIEAELASRPALPEVLPADPPPVHVEALVEAVAAGLGRRSVVFSPDPIVLALAADPAGRAFLEGGPLIPDQIVYAGSFPLLLEPATADDIGAVTASEVAEFAAARGTAPIVAVVPGTGMFATGDTAAQAATARDVYLDMLRTGATALRLGGVRHLDARERTFIERWEAEAYRKQVAASG